MKTKAQKIAELKAEIERLEKEAGNVWVRFEPVREQGYWVPFFGASTMTHEYDFDADDVDDEFAKKGLVFETPEQAAAVADAIIVMCQLRRCEGAGSRNSEGSGFIYQVTPNGNFMCDYWVEVSFNTICPAFPTKTLCMAAVEKVGRDRVIAAIKLWAMVDA